MAKTKALEIIYEISEILYRNGKYGMERIAIICEIIGKLMLSIGWDPNLKFNNDYFEKVLDKIKYELNINSYLQDKDEKQLLELFTYLIKENKLDIANSIKQLVENDKKTSGLIPTDDFSVKVMQAFAKKIYKGGIYVDPCIGTGRLLAGLGADNYYGFDIDRNAMKISETYLNLIENSPNRTRLNIKLSTENFLYRSFGLMDNIYNPTYIFDPPLNNLIEMNPTLQEHLYKNGIYSNGNKIPSEYAFLTQVLFGTHIYECSYICIFTNNFLFAQDKFKTSFRKYLFENSLIAVIQSNFSETTGIQKLILVGKSKLENSQNNLRYFITFKDKDVSEQNISKIAQKCLNNEIFDEKEFYDIAKVQAYTLEEIKENDYQISMPQYYDNEVNPNEIKSLDVIANKLKEINAKLISTAENLEILLENLQNGEQNIKKDIPESENHCKTEEHSDAWFDKTYSDLNNAIGIFTKGKEVEWTQIDFVNDNNIYIDSISSCLNDLKLLYNANRLRYNQGFLEIYSKKQFDNYKETKKFSEYIIQDNQNCEHIIKMFKNLSQKQIDIFNAFIKLQFDDENVFSSFTVSEIHSAIATFKILGLLYTLPDIDDEFEKYFPYTPILNIKEDY
ncbi:hypothetical protein J6E39_08120 [bacterium]|nr:hypothetical protein [bacterium]